MLGTLLKDIIMKEWLFFLLFIGIQSCSYSSNKLEIIGGEMSDDNLIKISSSNFFKKKDISPYLKSVHYVKLELNDDSMFGEITNIEIFNDKIYILDYVTGNLFVFTIDGKFLFSLNKQGSGPGEYTQIDFFSIDKNLNQIVIADLMTNNVMRYDLNGKFISKQKVPCWVDGVYPIKGGKMVLFTNYRDNSSKFINQYNILFIDSLSNIEKGYFLYPSSEISNVRFPCPINGGFYYADNNVNFFSLLKDTVYKIEDESIKPKYVFDFGKYKFDSSYLLKDPSVLSNYLKKGDFSRLFNINETDAILIYGLTNNGWLKTGFFSKNTGESFEVLLMYDIEDQMSSFHVCSYKSYIVFSENSESLIAQKRIYDKNGWPKGKFIKEKKEFLQTLTEDDNTVLVFCEFDDF